MIKSKMIKAYIMLNNFWLLLYTTVAVYIHIRLLFLACLYVVCAEIFYFSVTFDSLILFLFIFFIKIFSACILFAKRHFFLFAFCAEFVDCVDSSLRDMLLLESWHFSILLLLLRRYVFFWLRCTALKCNKSLCESVAVVNDNVKPNKAASYAALWQQQQQQMRYPIDIT